MYYFTHSYVLKWAVLGLVGSIILLLIQDRSERLKNHQLEIARFQNKILSLENEIIQERSLRNLEVNEERLLRERAEAARDVDKSKKHNQSTLVYGVSNGDITFYEAMLRDPRTPEDLKKPMRKRIRIHQLLLQICEQSIPGSDEMTEEEHRELMHVREDLIKVLFSVDE